MGNKDIIKKETKEESGIYKLDVDREKTSKVVGETPAEMLNNAIKEFIGKQQYNPQSSQEGNVGVKKH